ncbi:hypothetical protein IV102_22175 [bacterium]|nr:hypothetical protein [bacterium]
MSFEQRRPMGSKRPTYVQLLHRYAEVTDAGRLAYKLEAKEGGDQRDAQAG